MNIMTKDIKFQIECLSADLVLLLMEEYGWDMKPRSRHGFLANPKKITNFAV